eukprot:4605698-Pleurochrysis_carterae.AAC.1
MTPTVLAFPNFINLHIRIARHALTRSLSLTLALDLTQTTPTLPRSPHPTCRLRVWTAFFREFYATPELTLVAAVHTSTGISPSLSCRPS